MIYYLRNRHGWRRRGQKFFENVKLSNMVLFLFQEYRRFAYLDKGEGDSRGRFEIIQIKFLLEPFVELTKSTKESRRVFS